MGKRKPQLKSAGRADYVYGKDLPGAVIEIFELKPCNPRAIRAGIRQLHRYKNGLKSIPEYRNRTIHMILELY